MDDCRAMDEAVYEGLTALMVAVIHGDPEALAMAKRWNELQKMSIVNRRIRLTCRMEMNNIQLRARQLFRHLLS